MMDKNVLTLAYLGDSIYEIYIRKFLINQGIVKVNELQKRAINYVSAKNQCLFLKQLLSNNFFNNDELDIIYRARNHKVCSHPKHTDIVTYKHATALEAVIGYLNLKNQNNRIDEIMNFIIGA